MDQKSKEHISKITDNIIDQAKHFLTDTNEFYPFGTVITIQGELKPVSTYTGEEFPDSNELFKSLEQCIKEGISQQRYLSAGIGLDVFLTINNEKKSAVQVNIYDSYHHSTKYYVYTKNNGVYTFELYNH